MSQSSLTVGFIGLGLMGGAMTARLLEQGFDVHVFDIDTEKTAAMVRLGASAAESAAALAARVDILQICVTTTGDVERLALSDGGLADASGRVRVVLDHSTTSLEVTQRIASTLEGKPGIAWIDAPVSGGPPAARTGRLAVMCGGCATALSLAQPVLDTIAARWTHMGPTGAGQATKMVNQILVLNNYCVLAEALSLAEAAGVDASRIPQALADGHAGSNLLKALFPRLIDRDFEPAGYARQVLKDLDMVTDLARGLSVPTPMSAQAASLFRLLIAKGDGELDGIAVLKLYSSDFRLNAANDDEPAHP